MEGINKSFDVDGKFREIEKLFDTFNEDAHKREYKGMAIKIVFRLTELLKIDPKGADHNLTDKVWQFVDKIPQDDSVWGLSKYEKRGKVLMSFLNELAADKKFVPQIDRIFR